MDDIVDISFLEIIHPLNQIPPSHPASSRGDESEPKSPIINKQEISYSEEYDYESQESKKKDNIFLILANENEVQQ